MKDGVISLTGSYVMATAEHREPYESRGSRTVLGARGGAIPQRDSTRTEWLPTPLMSASTSYGHPPKGLMRKKYQDQAHAVRQTHYNPGKHAETVLS